MLSLGCDPSLTRTALAAIERDGQRHPPRIIETKAQLALPLRLRKLAMYVSAIVLDSNPDIVIVEEPGYMAAVGNKAQAAVHRATGAILAALPPHVRVEIVSVGDIRRRFGLGKPGTKRDILKAQVVAYLEERGIEIPRNRRGRPDHDVADAYLAALYGIEGL